MEFECPQCGGNLTLPGSVYEMCAECGYCSEPRLAQVKSLVRKADVFMTRVANLEQQQYEWASLINGLACEILDGIRQESIDMANDAIAMVNPYLGLNNE